MSQGYQPQTSDITKSLLRTFVLGVLLGSFLGYSVYPLFHGGEETSTPEETEVALTAEGTEENASEVAAPDEPAPEEPPAPVETVATVPPAGPFNADVDGLWPARHLFVGINGTQASVETLEWLNEFKPGGVVLGPENLSDPLQLSALILQIKQAVGLGTTIKDPPLIVYRAKDDAMPTLAVKLDRILDTNNGVPVATATDEARAARDHGIGVFLAPSLDLYLQGITAPEIKNITLGSQPGDVAKRGLAYVRQVRDGGVLPVATHFPGAGLSVRRSGGLWEIPADQMDAMSVGMLPFQEAIEAGIPGLLIGHMAVPGVDRDNPTVPASRSAKLLRIFLRDRLAFDGVAIADDLNKDPERGTMPLDRIAVTALVSGCDAVLLEEATRDDVRAICEALVRLSERRDFPAEQLKKSQQRLGNWHTMLAKGPTPSAPEKVVIAAKDAPTDVTPKPEVPVTEPTPPATEEPTTPAPAPKGEDETPAPAEEKKSDETATPSDENAMVTTKVTVKTPLDIVEAPAPAKPDTDLPAPPVDDPKKDDKPAESDEEKPKPAEEAVVSPAEKTPPTEDAPVTEEAPKPAEETPSTKEAPKPAEEAPTTKEAPKPAEETPTTKEDPKTDGTEEEFIEHTIARGESLLVLAKKYNVSVEDLMAWNNLETKVIKYGYKLKVRPKKAPADAKADEPADTEKAPEKADEKPADNKKPTGPSPNDEKPEADALETVEATDPVPAEAPALTGSVPSEAPDEATPAPATPKKVPQPADTDKRAHAVKAGETLKSIADNFGVTVSDLVAWNGLENEKAVLDAGATILVYLPVAAGEDDPAKAPVIDLTTKKKPAAKEDTASYKIHEVVAGDNLRRIAQKYGVTQQAIIELNKIDRPDHVQLGWKLKIPNKTGE